MLIALSSTNNITSPVSCSASDVDSSEGCSTERSAGLIVSGVFTEEASIKLVGVMRELGSRVSSFVGRSKYEEPCLVIVELLAYWRTRRSLRGPILIVKSVM
jgi:hypothetical protein